MKGNKVGKVIRIISIFILCFSFVCYLVLDKYFKEDKDSETIIKDNKLDLIHNDDLLLTLNYDLIKNNENTYNISYNLELNGQTINGTMEELNYGISKVNVDKTIQRFKNNDNYYVIKGLDDINYYAYKITERDKEIIFLFNINGKLLSKILIELGSSIELLEGENAEDYLNFDKYLLYIISEDKIKYLTKEFCNDTDNVLRENIITINNDEVISEIGTLLNSIGDITCNNIKLIK